MVKYRKSKETPTGYWLQKVRGHACSPPVRETGGDINDLWKCIECGKLWKVKDIVGIINNRIVWEAYYGSPIEEVDGGTEEG